jgi:hypothetical protein
MSEFSPQHQDTPGKFVVVAKPNGAPYYALLVAGKIMWRARKLMYHFGESEAQRARRTEALAIGQLVLTDKPYRN